MHNTTDVYLKCKDGLPDPKGLLFASMSSAANPSLLISHSDITLLDMMH